MSLLVIYTANKHRTNCS